LSGSGSDTVVEYHVALILKSFQLQILQENTWPTLSLSLQLRANHHCHPLAFSLITLATNHAGAIRLNMGWRQAFSIRLNVIRGCCE
jgi:hypothetical protein